MFERHFNTPTLKSFHWPGRLVTGRGAREHVAARLPRPLAVVADAAVAESDFVRGLKADGFVRVSGEPRADAVAGQAAALAPLAPAAILGIGGGSALDTAKAVHAALVFGEARPRDVARPPGAPLLAAMATTAGSGADTSRFFVTADPATGTKLSARGWAFVPDVSVLDPAFLETAPPEVLILGAFDAFLHLFETYACRHERCAQVDRLALAHIPAILSVMRRLMDGGALDDPARLALLEAAAAGGMAISNVRTGLCHTLGEALSAHAPLRHPETLFVFAEAVTEFNAPALGPRLDRLSRAIAAQADDPNTPRDLDGMTALWRRLFAHRKIDIRIGEILTVAGAGTDAFVSALLETAARDTVILKENPADLTTGDMACLARTSLSRALSAAWPAAALA